MPIAFLSRFRRDKRGAIAVLVAIAIIPLIGMIGIATDAARGFLAQSRLSSAVDAAALAGGQVYFQSRRDSDVAQFFNANFPPGFMGSTVTGPTVAADVANKTLTVTASAVIPTTFMRILGEDTMTVSASAQVTRESKALDVVLSVDMSGSMSWNVDGHTPSSGESSRLELAQSAATDMINILFGSATTSSLLRVGVVPWAGAVNVTDNGTSYGYDADGNQLAAADRVTAVDTTPFTNLHVHTVVNGWDTYKSPTGGQAQTKIYVVHNSAVPLLSAPVFAPGSSGPVQTWQGCVWARWESGNSESENADMDNGLTASWPGWSPMGPETQNDSYDYTYTDYWGHTKHKYYCAASLAFGGGGSTCTPCPANGITRLQNVKSVALSAISSLNIPSGTGTYYTDLPQGLVWAWRVLSPEAPFVEGATFQQNYPPSRAIVLLTDGENTKRYGDAYNGQLSDRDQRMKDIADAIKATGTEIYTIQFANSGSTTMTNLLKYVASEPNAPYYYNAPGQAELEAAFHEIGNHLSNLRLSK